MGMSYLVSAGYNSGVNMLEFLKIMRRYEYYSNTVPSSFLTHPGTDERTRYIDALLQARYTQGWCRKHHWQPETGANAAPPRQERRPKRPISSIFSGSCSTIPEMWMPSTAWLLRRTGWGCSGVSRYFSKSLASGSGGCGHPP